MADAVVVLPRISCLLSRSGLTSFLPFAPLRALGTVFLTVFFFRDFFERLALTDLFAARDFFVAFAFFDVRGLFFVFFFLDGMGAVYH